MLKKINLDSLRLGADELRRLKEQAGKEQDPETKQKVREAIRKLNDILEGKQPNELITI